MTIHRNTVYSIYQHSNFLETSSLRTIWMFDQLYLKTITHTQYGSVYKFWWTTKEYHKSSNAYLFPSLVLYFPITFITLYLLPFLYLIPSSYRKVQTARSQLVTITSEANSTHLLLNIDNTKAGYKSALVIRVYGISSYPSEPSHIIIISFHAIVSWILFLTSTSLNNSLARYDQNFINIYTKFSHRCYRVVWLLRGQQTIYEFFVTICTVGTIPWFLRKHTMNFISEV